MHTSASAATVARGAIELVALVVRAPRGLLAALGGVAHGVPSTLRAIRLAAFAAGCGTRVATARAAALARELRPVIVRATEIAPADTNMPTAVVSIGALERNSFGIRAMDGGAPTSRVRGRVVAQCQERALFLATLACCALRSSVHDRGGESKHECNFEGHPQRDSKNRRTLRIAFSSLEWRKRAQSP